MVDAYGRNKHSRQNTLGLQSTNSQSLKKSNIIIKKLKQGLTKYAGLLQKNAQKSKQTSNQMKIYPEGWLTVKINACEFTQHVKMLTDVGFFGDYRARLGRRSSLTVVKKAAV